MYIDHVFLVKLKIPGFFACQSILHKNNYSQFSTLETFPVQIKQAPSERTPLVQLGNILVILRFESDSLELFYRSPQTTDIRGKLRGVPGGHYHLDSQEAVLQKSLLKPS